MATRPDDEVEALSTRADLARSRMLEALSALDRRRHEVLDVEIPMKVRAALTIVGVAAVAGIAVALVVRAIKAGLRRRASPWMALGRFVPRLPAPPEPKPSGLRVLLRTIATNLAREVIVRVLDRLVEGAAAHEDLAAQAPRRV